MYGVMQLPLEACMAPVYPLWAWGSVGRKRQVGGTVHCYVDDYRFAGLMKDPGQILAAAPVVAVEPNISCYAERPPWQTLAAVGRKREVAAHWARLGIGLIVDLCMPGDSLELALLGVPRGWWSYATRAYAERLDEVETEYRSAVIHAGRPVSFLVVGGGSKVAQLCQRLPGAVHAMGHSMQCREESCKQ